jgi:uncharacterized protein with von Willebrand factor type A (vWA) domain
MTKSKLYDLFGIDDGDAPATGKPGEVSDGIGAGITFNPDKPAAAAVVPKHALDVDLWAQRRGRELLEGEYKDHLQNLEFGGTDEEREAAAADLFASAFESDPKLHETCTDKTRHEYMAQLLGQDEYAAIRTSTVLDINLSELAAVKFADGLATLRATRKIREEKEERDRKAGKKDTRSDAERELEREMEAMTAASTAVEEATEEVDAARDAAAACGMGGSGGKSGSMSTKSVGALYRRVKNDPALRRICELAGRYRRLAQGKQRNRAVHGYDDMVGVTIAGDVGRLVGSEMVMLGIDGMDDELALRITESRAFCREHRGVEPVGKGPIVVTVDESGSMSGEKVATAKAFALAMAWIARSQRRWCCLVGFSGGTEGNFLVLPPGRWDESALCDWLAHFYSNGTDMDIPLEVLPGKWPAFIKQGMTQGKTDIIMITDAQCHVPEKLAKSFLEFKAKEKVRLTALVLNAKPGDLKNLADEVHEVKTLGVGEEAVGKCVEI